MELILILIVALMVFGPDRLPTIGAKLGRAMRDMRKTTRAISDEISSARAAVEAPAKELAEPFKDVAGAAKAAGSIAAAARNPGEAIRQSVMKELNSPPKAVDGSAAVIDEPENTIAPPALQGETPDQIVTELSTPEDGSLALPAPPETPIESPAPADVAPTDEAVSEALPEGDFSEAEATLALDSDTVPDPASSKPPDDTGPLTPPSTGAEPRVPEQ